MQCVCVRRERVSVSVCECVCLIDSLRIQWRYEVYSQALLHAFNNMFSQT